MVVLDDIYASFASLLARLVGREILRLTMLLRISLVDAATRGIAEFCRARLAKRTHDIRSCSKSRY